MWKPYKRCLLTLRDLEMIKVFSWNFAVSQVGPPLGSVFACWLCAPECVM